MCTYIFDIILSLTICRLFNFLVHVNFRPSRGPNKSFINPKAGAMIEWMNRNLMNGE